MATQAMVTEQNNHGKITRKGSVLFPDEDGLHLFEAVDGSGWNSGLRFHEISASEWEQEPQGDIAFYGSDSVYYFVHTASRFPTEGSKLEPVENFEKIPDQYLCLYPADDTTQNVFAMLDEFGSNAGHPYALPNGIEIVKKEDRVILLETKTGQAPFFEHWAKGLSQSTKAAERIYSLSDAEHLLSSLPMLMIVVLLLIAGFVLISGACFAGKQWVIAINIMLGIACLCASAVLLYQLDLPASLMPTETIFDFPHYTAELKQVCSTLDSLGFPELSKMAVDVAAQCMTLLVSGVSVMLLLMVGELLVCRRTKVADDLRISYHT